MNVRGTIGITVCGLVLFAGGAAFATANPGHSGNSDSTTATSSSTETGTLPSQAKGYGFYCQNQSKKHVAGQKGTPFSQCVTAMAKLASGKTDSPTKACASMSKKHVKGQKGTPFSQCVSAGAKLLKNKH